jgi:hypothetical protein
VEWWLEMAQQLLAQGQKVGLLAPRCRSLGILRHAAERGIIDWLFYHGCAELVSPGNLVALPMRGKLTYLRQKRRRLNDELTTGVSRRIISNTWTAAMDCLALFKMSKSNSGG